MGLNSEMIPKSYCFDECIVLSILKSSLMDKNMKRRQELNSHWKYKPVNLQGRWKEVWNEIRSAVSPRPGKSSASILFKSKVSGL